MPGNLVAAAPAVGGGAHWVGHVERHAHRTPDRVARGEARALGSDTGRGRDSGRPGQSSDVG
jgi:hypothetical protein